MIEKILNLIEERGMSQAAVERRCGLSAARITKWKDGKGEPKASDILKIADLLGVPVRFLVDDKMERPVPDLNEQQRWILQTVERIGYDVAASRLLAVPEMQKPPAAEGQRGAEVEAEVLPKLDPKTGEPFASPGKRQRA